MSHRSAGHAGRSTAVHGAGAASEGRTAQVIGGGGVVEVSCRTVTVAAGRGGEQGPQVGGAREVTVG